MSILLFTASLTRKRGKKGILTFQGSPLMMNGQYITWPGHGPAVEDLSEDEQEDFRTFIDAQKSA